MLTCSEAVEALGAAGVRLTPAVRDLRGGSTELAFTDALALADEQATALPVHLAAEIRQLADAVCARYPAGTRGLIDAAVARIADRAVAAHIA